MKNVQNLVGSGFLRNAYFSYGTQILKIGLGFAWVTALTSAAGLEMYGMVALLTSMSGLVGNLLTFRTNEAVIKFCKRGELENSDGLRKLALGAGLALDLLVASFVCAVVIGLSNVIASELLKAPDAASAVALYSWTIFATLLRGTGLGFYTVSEQFRFIYTITVLEQAVRLGLLLILISKGVPLSVDLVVWLILLPAVVVTAILTFRPVFEFLVNVRKSKIPKGEFREYFRFSLSTFLSSSLKSGNRNIDSIILGYLTSPSSVAVYSLIRRFLSPLSMVVSPFYQQIFPKFVEAVSSGESNRIAHTISHTNSMLRKWSLLLLIPISLLATAYWLFMEFGLKTADVATFALMAASAMLVQQLWWTRPFALSHNPNLSVLANGLATILVISLVYLFTNFLGMPGTAVGMLGSYLVMTVFWRTVLSRYLQGAT